MIHPAAIVDKAAKIGEEVEIGPYCVIGPNVTIHKGTKLMSHVVIDGWTTVGESCIVFPFACLGTQTQDLKFRGGRTFVEIGAHTTLREYVTVNSSTNEGETTRVGQSCHICAYCHVAHACQVGNGVIMSNAVNLAGHVVVEDYVVMGGVTGVHQFVRIGTMSMVGGMSAISKDCAPYMLVDGNPSSVYGLNSVGLKRRGMPEETQHLLKQAHKILFRDGLSTSQALERIEAEVPKCPEIQHLVDFVRKSERGIIK